MKSVFLGNDLQNNHKRRTEDRHYRLMDLLCYDQTVSQEKKGCRDPKWHPHYNRACRSDFLRHFTPPVFSSAMTRTDAAYDGISPAVYSILTPATEATEIRRPRHCPRAAPPDVRSRRRVCSSGGWRGGSRG